MNERERALHAARNPIERRAAASLAQMQRNLSLAYATVPAEIADDPGVDDPETAYVAWIELLTEGERQIRRSTVVAIEGWRKDDESPDPSRPPVDVEFADEFVDAVARARAAVAAMVGPDRRIARAAVHDVLDRWPADDRTAAAMLAARFPDQEEPC